MIPMASKSKFNNRQRLAPRLQMIINGDDEVNAYRALLSASVTTSEAAVKAAGALDQLRESPANRQERAARKEELAKYERKVRVSCFVHLEEGRPIPKEVPQSGMTYNTKQREQLVITDLLRDQVAKLADSAFKAGIAYVEPGAPLSHPQPSGVRRHLGPPKQRSQLETHGEHPVLIGIIDVGGFDFSHPDFLDEQGQTRFQAIWDQGAQGGEAPEGFTFGHELTRVAMNRALEAAPAIGVSPLDIEPQSVQTFGSHGTHVASTAGGRHGVCPQALLAGVVIALDEDDQNRRASFFDSTRLAQAVDYLLALSERLAEEWREAGGPSTEDPGEIPIVINISLGTNGHAHDGTSPISRWIDSALAKPGRCVCVAAGNAGQEAATFDGDMGFVNGRIHSSGRVAARGLDVDLDWEVVDAGIADVSENEMEIWYEAGDEFAVSLRTPDGIWCCQRVEPNQFYENHPVPYTKEDFEGHTFVSVYNERYHPSNGANRISIFLSPRFKGELSPIQPGTWTVRLHGIEVRDGRFNAWIERDNPRPLGRIGKLPAWCFPSYFSSRSNVDRCSVSSLACGRDVIAVGNSDSVKERMNVSSSQGPTRDGRSKPDIAAPGTSIVAACGFSGGDERQQWMEMTGTSMASPFVAGVAAQMLAVEPKLSAAQILGIMRRTAQPLPGADFQWKNDAGFGQIREQACLDQVRSMFETWDLKKGRPGEETTDSDDLPAQNEEPQGQGEEAP